MSGAPPGDRPLNPPIDIDAARIAALLDLDVATFRQLMADGKIASLCERGTGADAGRWRATFWYGGRRARLVVDPKGRILGEG